MNRILFDHQIFTEQNLGGISRYFKHIIDGIKEIKEFDYKLGTLYSNNYYLRDEDLLLQSKLFRSLFKTPEKILKRNNSYTKFLIKQSNFDIFHATYYNPIFLKNLKKPLVVTVHDMTYEALPHLFTAHDPLPYNKRLLVERADKIIAISENTKNDLLKYLDIDENKIDIIHHGISTEQPKYEQIKNLPKRYILFVGTRVSYKNFYMLAEAFKILSEKDDDLSLVLAGGGELGLAEMEYLRRTDIIEKTMQISATDGELNTLYKNAICFVYPSLYEGFGLPILEAFKNNCPVLLSNCSCFPEVAGSAARYFEQQYLDSLVEELSLIIYDESIRLKMIELGKSRLVQFPIETCVEKTIETYKSL